MDQGFQRPPREGISEEGELKLPAAAWIIQGECFCDVGPAAGQESQ